MEDLIRSGQFKYVPKSKEFDEIGIRENSEHDKNEKSIESTFKEDNAEIQEIREVVKPVEIIE